ncbi:FAD-binding oxidoreductase [Candidatus Leptofilum sp.]|uniref:FAD-binding oxidoreductase n=1 Tax=Candidatus Leptofilum sp. TaxID=3241576 RepID=UPI003B59F745
MPHFNPVSNEVLAQLTAVLTPDQISTTEADRQQHAQDMSQHAPRLSEVVVWPTNSQQVADVLQIAHRHRIPVTPWGAGSSLEGNPIPLFGGITLSLARMNQIVALHADDFQVTVQPGLGYKDLNQQLGPHGLFFAPDPGANASIGGMLANNAAGSRTVKYGATKDNVLAMEVVLADGRILQTGSRSVKQSAGYDMLHLFVGSEGTLGVITQATLRLAPVSAIMSSAVATFADVETAVAAVVELRASGLDIAALEFIDAATSGLLSREEDVDWGENPTLLMEIHAAHAETAELDLALIQETCRAHGAGRFVATTDAAERQKMWQTRHHMFETLRRVFVGHRWQLADVAVPISQFPALVKFARQTLQERNLPELMVGHAGDGNLHIAIPYADEATRQGANLANEEVVLQAIALGGTATGEHGVGIGKAKFMVREHGETAVEIMRHLKQTLDPHDILNPGKIIPQP